MNEQTPGTGPNLQSTKTTTHTPAFFTGSKDLELEQRIAKLEQQVAPLGSMVKRIDTLTQQVAELKTLIIQIQYSEPEEDKESSSPRP